MLKEWTGVSLACGSRMRNTVPCPTALVTLMSLDGKWYKPEFPNATYASQLADGEDEVIDYETLINEVALLRNKWLGVMKGLDTKQWQLGHIVRLRTAGMEDISI